MILLNRRLFNFKQAFVYSTEQTTLFWLSRVYGAVKRFDIEKKILKTSADFFYRYGFVKASIRDIVKAVGINSSTVYLYFKSKDEILFRNIMDVGADLLEELESVIERHNNNPVECLREMISTQVFFSKERHKEMKIYLEELYQLRPHLRKKALEQHRRIYDLYYGKICELEERNVLYQADKTVITFILFSLMNWINKWFNPGGRLSIEEVTGTTVDIFFRGILKNGAVRRGAIREYP